MAPSTTGAFLVRDLVAVDRLGQQAHLPPGVLPVDLGGEPPGQVAHLREPEGRVPGRSRRVRHWFEPDARLLGQPSGAAAPACIEGVRREGMELVHDVTSSLALGPGEDAPDDRSRPPMRPDVDFTVIVPAARPAHHRIASQFQLLPHRLIEEELVLGRVSQVMLVQPGGPLAFRSLAGSPGLLGRCRAGPAPATRQAQTIPMDRLMVSLASGRGSRMSSA